MRLLIMGAFQEEIIAIKKKFKDLRETVIARRKCLETKYGNHDLVICLTGVGSTSAASTTTAICERFDPNLIILCGVAGGLDTDLKIGDLVLANKIIDADMYNFKNMCLGTPFEASCLNDPHTLNSFVNEYPVNSYIQELVCSLNIKDLQIGSVVSSNVFPAPKPLFSMIKSLRCSAIEMESTGVFKAAQYYDIPVMTIRAISNLLNENGDDLGTEPNALDVCSESLGLFISRFIENISKLEVVLKNNDQKKIADLV